MKLPKYLVRPDDYMVFILDETNNCYKTTDCPFQAHKYFTFDTLTKNFGFFPIEEDKVNVYEKLCNLYYGYIVYTRRNDGHGGLYIVDIDFEAYLKQEHNTTIEEVING